MNKENKKIIKYIIATVLLVIMVGATLYNQKAGENVIDTSIIGTVIEDIMTFEKLQELKEEVETTEVIESTIEEEQTLEIQETEDEGFEQQGEIAYESGESNSTNIIPGEKIGLTYYSQIDSRWRNIMYSSKNDSSQTIGSSGCGPTASAMVVTSIKGTITPDTMASIYVDNGYRSANNGTYWSAFRYTADLFNIGYQETADIQKALQLIQNNNYVIVSVGNGLFTTGGHYIVIVGIEGDTLKIYDPYMYSGKFDTSTRRGKVTISGNTVYCSIENFKAYANYKNFFAFENNTTDTTSFYKAGQVVTISTCYSQSNTNDVEHISPYRVATIAYVAQGAKNPYLVDFGNKQAWCNDGDIRGLGDLTVISNSNTSSIVNTVNQTKKLKSNTIIYSNSNLTGTRYTYKANTTVTVKKNISSSIDYIEVKETGRKGYISNKVYK